MDGREQLVDRHIREYESRQKHVDELIERAHGHIGETDDAQELDEIRQTRDQLAGGLEEMKQRPTSDWEKEQIEQAGPLAPLYALAEQLERLIEKLEK